jgi:phosphoglycerate dehydrogenase-like enzyme
MVAEHALALLLALTRRLPEMAREQRAHRWERDAIGATMRTLEESTVCVVGLGNIGRDVARRLKAFHARVIAVSREGVANDDIAEVFPRTRLGEAFAQADAVVLCTAADAASRQLIGKPALAALKPHAFLVNVARGALVDEPALIEALREGRLAGAALDVQATEPLPESSPLWDLPNVIVSPHTAGAGSSGYPGHRALFAENLARYLGGQPLKNEVRAVGSRQ